MSRLVIAIPSKGRLKDACGEWFAARGVALEQEAGSRGYRAALWGDHQFQPIRPESLLTRGNLRWIQPALRHAAFAAARS